MNRRAGALQGGPGHSASAPRPSPASFTCAGRETAAVTVVLRSTACETDELPLSATLSYSGVADSHDSGPPRCAQFSCLIKWKSRFRLSVLAWRSSFRLCSRPHRCRCQRVDEQKGYVSLTHGSPPLVCAFASFGEEIAFLKQHIAEIHKERAALESVCLVARTKRLLEGYISQLQAAGFAIYEIRRNAAEQRDKPGLRLATMHRVKGLEFEHVVVVAVNKGIIPLEAAVDEAEDAVAMRNAETGERSLLYVALTRARRSATITSYGMMSPYLSTAS